VPTAAGVVLLGLGLVALGLIEPDMYVIGIVVVLIGAIGVTIKGIEWLRWLTKL
jgi:hypothetical protein